MDILPPSKHPEGKMKHVLQVDVHSFIDLAKICPFVIAGPMSDRSIFLFLQACDDFKSIPFNDNFLMS